MGQVRAFAARYVLELSRSPVGLFWSFAFPAIWFGLTVHLGIMPGVPDAGRDVAGAIMGISFGIFGAFTVALVGFTGDFAVDLDAKRYRTFRSLPLSPSADLAGRIVAAAAIGLAAFGFTLAIALVGGASFRLASPLSVIVVPVGVILFCLIGMVAGLGTALVVPRPGHATTVATGAVVLGFFVTGYNGTVPAIFPLDPQMLNYVPNALATRIVVDHLVRTDPVIAGLSPPAMPASPTHLLTLAGYAIGLCAAGLAIMHYRVYAVDAGERA